MKPLALFLGLVMTAIWGVNFVFTKWALVSFPPFLLTALRFILACLPILILPRPKGLSWGRGLLIGSSMFLGQYSFLYLAMMMGMPPGLASITLQVQAFFTMFLAVILLGETLKRRQIFGGLLAFAGLALIGSTAGVSSDIPSIAIVFILLSALSWALGNVMLRAAGPQAGGGTVAGVAWLSLAPPLPALGLSALFEGPAQIETALSHPQPLAVFSLLFIVVCSTWIGFGIWGWLMQNYPASQVAAFTLLVPGFGALSSWLILGEQFSPLRIWGSLLIIAGLMVIVLPQLPKRKGVADKTA